LIGIDPRGLLEWTCIANGNFDDRNVRGKSIKYCTYSCTAKCAQRDSTLSATVSAPGFETGQGQVCYGSILRTKPSMDGNMLATYAIGYEEFTVNTTGFWSFIDGFRRPAELIDELKQHENSGGGR
jgi:hypothetical protein